MAGQIPRPIVFVATLLMCGEVVGLPTNTARADDCLAQPNSSAPSGSHWYYRLDLAKQRKCWYLRAPGQPVQHAVVQTASEAAHATHTTPTERPATTSQGAPDPINPTDSPPAWPRSPDQAAQHAAASAADSAPPGPPHITILAVKPVRTQNATTDEPIRESSLRGSIDSAIPAVPAPQTTPLSQIGTQATEPTPAANTEKPDSSVTMVEAEEATAVPSDVRTESVRPSADAIVPDDAEGAVQGDASTTNTIGTMTSLTLTTTAEMFPILALALFMASLLFRIVIRIAAAHGQRRIIINRDGKNDSRLENELRDDQWCGSVKERDEFIDDDFPRSADDQWSDNSRRTDHPSDIKDAIRKRQDMLEELTRNLDRMLRSPRVV
jgi:hypothetical protein